MVLGGESNMEGPAPGMSLFQGAASIHINNSAQDRLDEQEELEDQKRRNEELQHKLANAFDDLQDDDEASSVNSSGGNFTLHSNGGHQVALANQPSRSVQPPTYVESLHHIKESQESPRQLCETPASRRGPPAHCETPVNHHGPARCEDVKGSYAGGDAHNHYCQEYRGHVNGINSYDARQEIMNNEQLKVMYEMRVKECQQLAAQVETLETEVDSLRGRLQAACSDRDKAELSLQEAHHMLASSKHVVMEMEQRASSLSQQLRVGEDDRQRLQLELAAATGALQDAQRRLLQLQVAHSHDTDTLFREQQERHREEVDRLQTDLIRAKNRLDEKENEVKILEKRCLEKDREKEAMLIEKGSTVNRLASELEAAQSRLLAADTSRMHDKSKLEATVQELATCRSQLATALAELQQWRSALQHCFPGEPQSPSQLAALKDVFNRQKQQLLKLTTLQDEINKRDEALERYKKHEAELQSQVEAHQTSESQLKDRIAALQSKMALLGRYDEATELEQRNAALAADLADARKQLKALGLQHAELEVECAKLRGSRDALGGDGGAQDAGDVLRELERCNAQLRDTLRDNGDLKNLYLQACSARDAMSRELKEVQSSLQKDKDQARLQEQTYMEKLRAESERVEQVVAQLATAKLELDIANRRVADMQRQFTDTQRQFTDRLDKYLEDEKSAMRNEMSSCAQCDKLLKQIPCLEEQITQCTMKLAAAESNSQLISELKDKAEFFQRYITERHRQLGARRSVGTNTAPHEGGTEVGTDPPTDTDTDDLAVKTTLMLQEKAIRDQIADKYTLEIKTIEMNCSRRVKEMELQHYQTIMTLKELVESKAHQVDVLKDKLLAEKGVATQMLDAKEKEISELIKEHNELQQQCQETKEELAKLTHRHEHRVKKLAAQEALLQQQTDEWKEKAKTAVLEHQALRKKYAELKTIRREAEDKCRFFQNELQTLQEKYNNCKKTVLTYKDYIGKKDEHIGSEMRRIQCEYREMFSRLQDQLDRACSSRRALDHPATAPCDYEERINQLGEEFARITEFRQPDAAP